MKKTWLIFAIVSLLICNSFTKALAFNDTDGTSYADAINDLSSKGIIEGYSDGSYKPFTKINRAEFTKILIESRYPGAAVGENCFVDVYTEWFSPYICFAYNQNIINGHPDGTFRPGYDINLAEALKIALEAYDLNIPESSYLEWYEKYYWFALSKGLLNGIDTDVSRNINRGEVAQLIYNILQYTTNTETLTKPILISPVNNIIIPTSNLDIDFSWNPVQNAVSYDLILNGIDKTFSVGNKTQYKIPIASLNLSSGQFTYSWQVRAHDLNDNSITSDPSYFTLNISNISGNDLGEIWKNQPSQEDIDQIINDFEEIIWEDNLDTGEVWPSDFTFDQTSTKPSKMVIISLLKVLKHQEFSEPLPFTNLSVYDYFRTNIRRGSSFDVPSESITQEYNYDPVYKFYYWNNPVKIFLTCTPNSGSYFKKGFGYWFSIDTDSCTPISDMPHYYIDSLQVMIHEARHAEFDDPRHTSCGILTGNDQYLENGSGYAYAVQYLMWVYKYSINDPPEMKERAKYLAIDLLKNRFCTTPTHSNPKVQAIIDELLQN